ncbi:putative SNAP25 homologous protein SNAP30 [Durio zibethinus]|uniref:SNAP25 homologous protein SNAP30 n=1 Tax=Durio zibethinus TaxID=66656 RepID=A0A6P5Y5E9_DURZI|nr:putative SNAP25 homologous protein SNAP30 [Durio zibethinus]
MKTFETYSLFYKLCKYQGEKLLNGLGGMFSKPWKPKKTREIKGPVITSEMFGWMSIGFYNDLIVSCIALANKSSNKSENHKKQREKLGLAPVPKAQPGSRTPPPEPTNAIQKVELEKAKQDDALSDLSNILGDLNCMAAEMGSELERQNKALDHLQDDVD